MFRKIAFSLVCVAIGIGLAGGGVTQAQGSVVLPDTGQGVCYDNQQVVACPSIGSAFFGQDAQYAGSQPSYTANGDGTVTDNVTGLLWAQSPDLNGDGTIDAADKLSYSDALAGASTFTLAGYTDWRLPTITELYSLLLFDGADPSGLQPGSTASVVPFIDTRYFDFAYGDASAGERTIDAQFASSTLVVSSINGRQAMFGVNFADGRIKGYPTGPLPGQSQDKGFYVLYVRGNADYGTTAYVDNGDGTVTDAATGLTWQQADNGAGMNWQAALDYCETLDLAGYDDWRLPNVRELQYLVDYSRSPDTTGSAAIDPLFQATPITNEAGQVDYAAYWSSITHANLLNGANAAYVTFGRALGYLNGWVDIHGAGAQRSDPKAGDAAAYPTGHGPQGDAIRIDNLVRCVRGGGVTLVPGGMSESARPGMTVTVTATEQAAGPGVSGQNGQSAGQPANPPSGQPPQGGNPPAANNGNAAPPQIAIDACSGAAQGTACQFTSPQGTITGTCLPAGGQIACVPAGGAPG